MTRLDDRLVPAAKRILDKFGKTMPMTVLASQAYDPDARTTTDGSATTVNVKGAPPFPAEGYLPDDLVEEGDAVTIIAKSGLTITPVKDMAVVIDGTTWRVIDITEFHSGDQIAAFQLHLRH